MRMWRRGIQVLMLTALAGLLVAGAPGLAAYAANGDLKALAEEAIYEATVLVAEYSQTLDATDEAGRERLRQAEKALQRAQNRFGSRNYEGALEHAEEAIAILD